MSTEISEVMHPGRPLNPAPDVRKHSSQKYRPEIDGLRAVAILLVLLFHAELGVGGGFVGVDVFFVISGFLITQLILADVRNGTFHFLDFWERRARRIFPAMAAMLLGTVAAALVLMFPRDLIQFCQSITFSSLVMENWFFCRSTGYFAAGTETKPLLHMWSLAVEEQFYLFLPLLLLAVHKVSRRALAWVLLVVAGLSFVWSVMTIQSDPEAAFFLLPSRSWELLLGSLLSLVPIALVTNRIVREGVAWAGLAAIIWASVTLNTRSAFPGTLALMPCLGAAAVIWANSPGRTSAGRVLALPPLRFIGLISYSLYLCHWPIFAFARYAQVSALTMTHRLTLVAASLIAALLSWRFVETPFRKRKLLPGRWALFAWTGATLAAIGIAGNLIIPTDGLRWRFSKQAMTYADAQYDQGWRNEVSLQQVMNGDFPVFGVADQTLPASVLLWGDSHAMFLAALLDSMCKEHQLRGVMATHTLTAPVLDFQTTRQWSMGSDTVAYNEAIVQYAITNHVHDVVIAGAWRAYGFGYPSTTQLTRDLQKTVDALRAGGCRVWIFADVPEQEVGDPPRALALAAIHGTPTSKMGITLAEHLQNSEYQRTCLASVAASNVTVLDPAASLTDENGICRLERDGTVIYFDNAHLTRTGAERLRPLFQPIFDGYPAVPSPTATSQPVPATSSIGTSSN